jgi:hypothetical protein
LVANQIFGIDICIEAEPTPNPNGASLSGVIEDFERWVFTSKMFKVGMPRTLQPVGQAKEAITESNIS